MELSIEVNIPEGKEVYVADLFALAAKWNSIKSREKVTPRGTKYTFYFENETDKNSFFDAIPIKWVK